MDAALRDLLDLLDLEQIDRDTEDAVPMRAGSAYTADKSLAALVAASRTVSEPKD